jgi:uncharacterized protein (DUF433 family)
MAAWVITDPKILGGKPCIRGTRVSVAFVLELLASGASRQDILDAYPTVPRAGLDAAIRYAAKAMKNEVVWDVRVA